MTRRKFIKTCLAAAGLTAFSGCGLRTLVDGTLEPRNTPSTNQHGNKYRPKYLDLAASGELEHRERELWKKMENCSLCPRMCGVNRMAGKMAVCSTDHTLRVASSQITWGEERVIVGSGGAGSIFISNCNLLCIFCQNWQIAHHGKGRQTSHAEFANMMLELQQRGAHNVGIVTPTHIVPHMVTALRLAIEQGLNIPLIYDTSGYETVEVLQLLDGIVDVYQPDFKFQDCEFAAPFLKDAPGYARYTAAAIKEMHRQVGTLKVVDGIANQGLLIRHLVLPENAAGTDKFARWVVDELGADTHVNIMAQYRPEFMARYHPPLDRRITQREFNQAMRWAREAGLRNFH
ncbi:MAG: radical SAM protein [Spirochaetes bacterium]|nr:radical SAM protein [Spirochaetota bacterium]